MNDTLSTDPKSGNKSISSSAGLTSAELTQLQRFLPANLMETVAAAGSEPPKSVLSPCVRHLASLLEATTSHLPASLVRQVRRQPHPGQADGEFVEGTLLFADISGFTAMSEQLSRIGREGAEEVTEVVNRYFDAMLDILRAHDGQLIRFGGDALLGLFTERPSTQHSFDDMFPELSDGSSNSATLAIQAAMKMQAAMVNFAETKTSKGTFPLRMSVGVKRGRFFAAQLGSLENMEYALFGPDVNATAAVESAASAGQVLIDQVTYEAVGTDLLLTAVPLPNDPRFLLVEHIDQPLNQSYNAPQDTLYPLAPDMASLRRHITWLATFTPYLPTGLLPRLASDPRAPSLKGEHRLVASLFANVDGLGEVVARLGDGQELLIVHALNQYYVRMSEAIRPFGGVMNKIDLYDHGDKALITFGAPIAHEDDAERAVRAALAMQAALAELNQTLPAELGLADWQLSQRIGISYGYVFAGYVGASWRHEYTVMGDEVNLAARLMSAAKEGCVLVNENVRRQTNAVAELQPEGAVELKGKSQPVPIFAVTGLRMVPEQMRGIQGLHAPLIGRDAERAALQDAIDQLSFGFGRIVSLIGEAGQGKSRLAYEVQQEDIRWFQVRCLSFTETVSYRPFRELVRQLVGIQPEMEADLALQTLVQTLYQNLPADEASDSLPYLANFLKLPLDETLAQKVRYLDGDALRQHTVIAIRTLLMAQARIRPLIIWFDNIHWMDNASLDLLTFLLPLVEQLPLLFLLPFRPEREKGSWQLRRTLGEVHGLFYTEIRLEGLTRQDAQTLLHALVPLEEWPIGAETLILDRAEGNPLYLEEVLRSLINDGFLTQAENGRWQFSQTVAAITVPETLEGVLLARLDRLEELCRWTAQVASVVGRSFPYDVLEHLTRSRNDQPLDGYVSELQLVEMIREAQINPERVYAFIHSLLQEVAYNSLAVSSRKTYHRLVAAFLEDGRSSGWGDADSLPPLIAHHAFMGEDWQRALKYQLMAGELAQKLSANQDAISHFLKAHHCAMQLEGLDTATSADSVQAVARQKIHLALSQLYIGTGQYDEALEHLPVAFEQAHSNRDAAGKTAVCRWRARLHELRGEYDQAFIWIKKGLADETQRHTAEYAQILLIAGLIHIRQGQQDEALAQCLAALEIAEQLGEVTALARAYNLLGITSLRSDNNEAIARFQRAFELYQRAGDVQGQATSHNLIANAYFNLGRWRKADFHYRQALRIFEQIGDIYNQAVAHNNLGGIAKNRGQIEEALTYYQQGLQLAEKIGGSAWMVGVFHMNLGATFVLQQDPQQAIHHLRQSRSYYDQVQSKDFLAETLRYLAEAALLDGDLALATAWAVEGIEIADELEMVVEAACCWCVLGQISLARAELATAVSHLRQSVNMLTPLADEYQLARSRYWLARALLLVGQQAEARRLLGQAQAAFTHLDAALDLTAVQALQKEGGTA